MAKFKCRDGRCRPERPETRGESCCKETSHLINEKKKKITVKVTKPQLWLCQNTQELPGRASSSAIYLQSWLCLHQSTSRGLSHPHPSRHPFTGINTRCRQPEPSPPHKSLLASFGIQFLLVLLLWLWKMEDAGGGAPLIICLNNTGNSY